MSEVFGGGKGSGKLSPVVLVRVRAGAEAINAQDSITPQAFGSGDQVYTTSRTNASGNATTRYFPYRAAGKLWFKNGSIPSTCSASLIKRGVMVTAAHCVAEFGKKQFYSAWRFAPGYDNGVAPFGQATAKKVYVNSSYFDGTASCAQSGVVCTNDIAVIVLNTNIGNTTGWYGYGVNGYGYRNNQVLISQLGYPGGLDKSNLQMRTESQGYVSAVDSNNTVIGSLQNGGSSGGPWLVNLGMAPSLSGISFGSAASYNIVVGVTSWGWGNGQQQQGASSFTSDNILPLVSLACKDFPSSC
ncbi:MAG: trypsin-like serine protease [Methylococcaceae bacterium]|nr:trypsin-like serine protease [Methylococcaceae bacterium]